MNKVKLEDFFTKNRLFRYKKGEFILRDEEEPAGIYYLSSGYVRMVTYFADGKELTINIFKPGSYFPMMWAIGEVANKYYFQAFTAVEVYRASKDEVINFLDDNQDIYQDLTRRLMVGVDGLLLNVKFMLFGSVYERVISALVLCVRRFGKRTEGEYVVLEPRFTHQDIANLAGITRESVSITMKMLAKRKIISYKGHQLRIHDVGVLEEELYIDGNKTDAPLVI